jgi:hypothetical protein
MTHIVKLSIIQNSVKYLVLSSLFHLYFGLNTSIDHAYIHVRVFDLKNEKIYINIISSQYFYFEMSKLFIGMFLLFVSTLFNL